MVWGLGLRVSLGLRAYIGLKVHGLGFGFLGLGFKVPQAKAGAQGRGGGGGSVGGVAAWGGKGGTTFKPSAPDLGRFLFLEFL